ncbi:MAG: cupin domain-containing protein [Thermoleophilia bacterium]|nr:cupin domain-containing protein [Thermoleophilia bacterium]
MTREPIPEAKLVVDDWGTEPHEPGWFVLNARDIGWERRDGRGYKAGLTSWSDTAAEHLFRDFGANLRVLEPGQPMAMYHHEADTEGFFVLQGEALLVIEETERSLRQWDYVHCPAGARHTIIGAGDGPCTLLAMGSRKHITEPCNRGGYVASEVAARHGASPTETTDDTRVAYAHFGASEPATFRPEWLPGD